MFHSALENCENSRLPKAIDCVVQERDTIKSSSAYLAQAMGHEHIDN